MTNRYVIASGARLSEIRRRYLDMAFGFIMSNCDKCRHYFKSCLHFGRDRLSDFLHEDET